MDVADTLVDKIFSWVELQQECADKLDKLANEMEKTQKGVNVAKVVGSSVSVAGAATATLAGVATLLTGGAALPVIGVIAGAATWAGLATDATSDVVNAVTANATLNEAEEVVEKIEDLHQDLKELTESLKKEAQRKGRQDGSCDDRVLELILRGMARRNGLIFDDCVCLRKILEDHFDQTLKPAVLSFISFSKVTATVAAKTVRKLLAKLGAKAAKGAAKSAAGKAAGKAVGRMAGGAFGLVTAIPELIDNCKNLDSCETKASLSLRENAKAIRTESAAMKKDLQDILNLFRRLAKVKDCIENRKRSSADRKVLIEFVMERCRDEDVLQWLRENSESEAFFKLMDMFQLLTENLDDKEKKNHSNTVDITFVAHGSMTDSMISAGSLCQPGISDVLLYSPWNCVIDATVAYSVATGLIEPQHRVFSCDIPDRECCCCCFSNKKRCDIPDAEHQPTKLPNEWNSMKNAGHRKIPNIMLRPLRQRKDGAWKAIEILKKKHVKPGTNRIVVPFILPGKSKEEVPFFAVSLALSLMLLFSRVEATLHLTACLSKRSGRIKIDEDTLKEQYACTIDNTRMTSSEGAAPKKNKRLFRAFKALFA